MINLQCLCRLLKLTIAVLAIAAPMAAQPPCPPWPPPAGPVISVTSAQASSLRGIVAGAASGTTILLQDGVYAMDQGDATSRLVFSTPNVTLRSASGNAAAVVLDGAYQTNELISIYASDVVIADLTLRRAYDHPIHISGNGSPITGVVIHGVQVIDPGQQAIKINPVGSGWVDDGIIECSMIELTDAGRAQVRDNCYTGGIDAHQAQGWLVRRNFITGFWCEEGLSEHGVHFWKASRDTVVEENVIVDCARGIGFGLGQTGDSRAYADDPYPGVGYLGHIDGIIRNNFIAAADADLFASADGFDAGIAVEQAREPWIVHNTVASTTAPFSSIEWRFGNTLATIANNLVTHQLRPRNGAQAVLQNNLEMAPAGWFRDIVVGDLHLTADDLPPVDAGASLPVGVADLDIDLEPRSSPPDVGADEALDVVFSDGFESGNLSGWTLSFF